MSYTLIRETKRRAAKAHRCIWCGESIPAGSVYRDERSVYDGEIQHHKWHSECLDAMHEEAHNEGGTLEFLPYDNERPVPPSANLDSVNPAQRSTQGARTEPGGAS